MSPAFFPDPLFGWVFLAALFALLLTAAWIDVRTMILPKWLTVPAFAAGLVGNLIRGASLGAAEIPTWVLGYNGWLLGALDGLLFALAGFLVGFGLFFLLWFLGVCGGGDVKLFAALGAWVGPGLVLRVLLVTLAVVFCFVLGRLVRDLFRGDWKSFRKGVKPVPRTALPTRPGAVARKRALGFALPLTIAAALVLPWALRADLRVLNSSPDDTVKEHAHAR